MEFKNVERKNLSGQTSDLPYTRQMFSHSAQASSLHFSQNAKTPQTETKQAHDNNQNAKSKILEMIISISFVALFFGIPLFFLNKTFQGIIFEKQIYFYFWVLVAMAGWAVKGIINGEIKIKKTPLDYFIAAFLVAYFLSTVFSIDRWHSFIGFFGDPSRGLVSLVACILVYYFILSNFTKQRLIISLAGIIAAAGLIEIWTISALFFSTKFPDWILNNAPISLFGSVTSLGIFLSLVYPLFIIVIYKLLESEMSKKPKMLLSVVVGLFLILDIALMWFLYTFIFWPAILIGISFFVIFVISLIVRPLQGWSWFSIVSFGAILIMLLIGGGDNYLPQKLPVEISPMKNLSWDVAKGALGEKFFIGTGVASYGFDFSKFRPQELNNTQFFNLRFYQGTGLFFEALPTIGVLGVATLILIVLTYLGTSVYLLSREKDKNKLYSLGIFSASLIFLINAFLVKTEGSILIFGVLICALSLATIQFESSNEWDFLSLSLKASPKYALAAAFIFMLVSAGVIYMSVFVGKVFAADFYMKKAVTFSAHNESDSVAKMLKAINLYPKEARYYNRLGQEYMILANNEALKSKSDQNTNLIQQYLNNAILLSNKSKEMMPNDVLTIESLAQVNENSAMFVKDSIKIAQQGYQDALGLEPHNPAFFTKLGEIKIAEAALSEDKNQKKQFLQEAIDYFQKSIDKKSDYAIGYYYLSVTNEALGEMDKAISSMENAIASDRGNIDYIFTLANLHRERGKGEDYAIAENIYKQLIDRDDKQVNFHLAIGILHEKQKKNDLAIAEYKKALALIPEKGDDAKTQINKMISNVQSGIGNLADPSSGQDAIQTLPENIAPVGSEQDQSTENINL